MFAFDHGYHGFNRWPRAYLDLLLPQLRLYGLLPWAPVAQSGTCVSPEVSMGIARVSSGSSAVRSLTRLSLLDIEDAIRMNADCMAVQTHRR